MTVTDPSTNPVPMARVPSEMTYCSYCGRLSRRCDCHEPNSHLQRFLDRGGKRYVASWRASPYKRGVPPQIKQAERRQLQKHYKAWYAALAEANGECCVNCDETADLVLDHVIPIAKGGLSRLDNLQLLCSTCNRIKGKLAIDCRSAKHQE